MSFSPDKYLAAIAFAADHHGKQLVPGGERPYVVHLASVAMEVIAAGGDDLAVQCALLHDTIEDAGVTHAALAERFGAAVADGVLALTKDESLPKAERMADSLRRIRDQPPPIAMVKLADRITNLQPAPAHWSVEKRTAYRAEAVEIADALAGVNAILDARIRSKIANYAL